MINFLPVLSTILPLVASGLLFLVFLINICCKIRRKFPISVNCWFCNTWTKVHYDNRNSFDCPTCLQYNGFTKDGDYNKIIPEQHDELMNKSTRIKNSKTAPSNGLCVLCNNNQHLKIIQLANFVPLVEENYDVEIEHFQEQLEKAYKLCRKCNKVLNKTIDKQTAWIFGNRVKNLCTNGFSSVQKISNGITKRTNLSLLSMFNGTLSIILVTSLLLIILSNVKYVTTTVSKHLPVAYLPVFKDMISLTNPLRPFRINLLAPYTSYELKTDPFIFVCCSGLFVQVIGSLLEKYSTTEKINRLLCWTILLLTSRVHFHNIYGSYILVFQICSCVYLLCTSFNKAEDKSQTKTSNRFMRKVVKNLEHTCSMTDFSDTSDVEEVSSSSKKTSTTQDSLDYLNRSTCSVHSNLQNYVPAKNDTFNTANKALNNYTELNKSLNNLHLGGLNLKSFSVVSVPVKLPKPVLSPPKFQSVNSWVAGGFWRNEDGVIMPVVQRTNLSRSSSESSGFGSQHNDNCGFVPLKKNFQADFDKLSVHSEFAKLIPNPNHVFSPIKGGFGRPPSFSFGEPISEPYQRNNLFQNWSDKINGQATQSFRDLRLQPNSN